MLTTAIIRNSGCSLPHCISIVSLPVAFCTKVPHVVNS